MQLDDDIYTNDYNYFYTLHGPRFEYMNEQMANALAKKHNKTFKPIRILSATPSEQYPKSNYIVINSKAEELSKNLGSHVVYLQDYEDMNVEFINSQKIAGITTNLLKKQNEVYVYPFTTSFLDLDDSAYSVIGPHNKIATSFDSKINQYKLFQKLNLPINNVKIYDNKEQLMADRKGIVPSYISAAYSSGGNESSLIYSEEMLLEFIGKLRTINSENSFIVADVFENVKLAPNVNALVTSDGEIYILVVSDQILHGIKYLGNTYPSKMNEYHNGRIHEITHTVGEYLAEQGYVGLFGLDFLINDKGDIVVVDLNPRHQGGYACNGAVLESMGINLADVELKVSNDEYVDLDQDKLNGILPYSWGHSKIAPQDRGTVIKHEIHEGSIEKVFNEVGSQFLTEFYQGGLTFIEGYIGYQVCSAGTLPELEAKMLEMREDFYKRVLGL